MVDPDLIGDFSQPFALPLTSGDHTDLKSVSCETLAALLRGEYDDSIGEFKVGNTLSYNSKAKRKL